MCTSRYSWWTFPNSKCRIIFYSLKISVSLCYVYDSLQDHKDNREKEDLQVNQVQEAPTANQATEDPEDSLENEVSEVDPENQAHRAVMETKDLAVHPDR